jgi:molybdopterin-guanine dinucleotide biosynthesis protein B
MHELRGADELTLGAALARLSPCDLVLVEGYKRSRLPKLEIYRAEVAKPWLHPDDPAIVGIASDVPPPAPGGRVTLGLDAYDEIATFVAATARPPLPGD